jgi:hypothetical protein
MAERIDKHVHDDADTEIKDRPLACGNVREMELALRETEAFSYLAKFSEK